MEMVEGDTPDRPSLESRGSEDGAAFKSLGSAKY